MGEVDALTRSQKAAAILVAMGKPVAGRLLKFFKQDELKDLIEAARALHTIPQNELDRIVTEFEAEFAEGAGLLDSGDQMDNILSDTLSPEEVDALLTGGHAEEVAEEEETVWTRLEQFEPKRLARILEGEHPQTIAFVLASIGSRQAAAVLLCKERPLRSEIVKRMMTLAPVKPAIRQLIEKHLEARLEGDTRQQDTSDGEIRVASLLREFDKSDLDEVMGDLEAAGLANLQAVRSKLFSFEDIVLLSKKALVSVFDDLSTEIVVVALSGASPEITEAVLGALGSRSRRMIESELSMGSEASEEDVQRARRAISSVVLDLAAKGQLELPAMDRAA